MNAEKAYASLLGRLKEVAVMGSVGAVLDWDENTFMPPAGAAYRGEQMGVIARVGHEWFTAKEVGEWIEAVEGSALAAEPESTAAVNVREARRAYDRATRLPGALVEALSRTRVMSQQAWAEAKKKSDYAQFEPWLKKTLELKRQEAACYAQGGQGAYDALLESYEPGETQANLERVFGELRRELVDLVGRIAGSGKQAPVEILERSYPAEKQAKLARWAAEAVGFDYQAGRLDVSVHPFSTQLGPHDARITTRYDERYLGDGFFGTLHEAGHAMYSQGLPADDYGTPCGEDLSLGIHESQSRMWENLVGRSKAFWIYFLPRTRELFGKVMGDVSLDEWYWAVNDVRPSLIRTEADEATYNLHVMLRFELERALLSGDLATGELPGAWVEGMERYLGVKPPDDARGCLQDVHWSSGSIGYFPTYTLGNLYAAQFYEAAEREIPGLEAGFAEGRFAPLLRWLRKNIHSQGKRYRASDLVRRVTGKPLSAEALMRRLKKKAAELYGV